MLRRMHVTVIRGPRSEYFIWDTSSPLTIGYPPKWILVKTQQGASIFRVGKNRKLNGPPTCTALESEIDKGAKIELPRNYDRGFSFPVDIRISRLRSLRPSYLPWWQKTGQPTGHIILYSGVRHWAQRSVIFNNSYGVQIAGRRAFTCRMRDGKLEMSIHCDDLNYRSHTAKEQALERGKKYQLSAQKICAGSIWWHMQWWRFEFAPRPQNLPYRPHLEKDIEESDRLKKLGIVSLLLFLFYAAICIFSPSSRQTVVQTVDIDIGAHKILPKVDEPKTNKDLFKPPPKVAKEKMEPKRRDTQKKRRNPPPVIVHKPIRKPTPSAEVLAQRAITATRVAITKSLGFLSSAPSGGAVFRAQYNNAKGYQPVANISFPVMSGKKYVFGKNTGPLIEGPIDTKSSRTINAAVGAGYYRGDYRVMGKVSVGSLSSGGSFGDSLSSGGLSLGGSGRISEAALLNALAKRLQQFQYCYEKSLLRDAQLAGNIVMEWTISTSGGAFNIKVVKSQLNRSDLHSCIASEIGKIRFPSPTGGSVIVKYPFNFSSTSL